MLGTRLCIVMYDPRLTNNSKHGDDFDIQFPFNRMIEYDVSPLPPSLLQSYLINEHIFTRNETGNQLKHFLKNGLHTGTLRYLVTCLYSHGDIGIGAHSPAQNCVQMEHDVPILSSV